MGSIFDEVIERRDTDCLKYDFAARRGKPEDVLPLWVADMDFRAPECVLRALADKSRHGIFGYSESREDYTAALAEWFRLQHGWRIEPDWLVKTPGVVFALYNIIRAFSAEGDGVIIQQPVYYPFARATKDTGRRLVVSPLLYKAGRYSMDLADFEKKLETEQVRLFIACSPHNPVGRVWTREELEQLGDICLKHKVLVVSDEIHQDFVYAGHKQLVFADIKPEFLGNTITCTAPSKTFNLAGLQTSNVFVADKGLRHKLKAEIARTGYGEPNIMGLVACRAAYKEGRPWLEELLQYLAGNLSFVREFVAARLPGVRLVEPEGTYLAWLDFTALGLGDKELDGRMVNQGKLWLDTGSMFGLGGDGFQRINLACPRVTLAEACQRMETAVKDLLR